MTLLTVSCRRLTVSIDEKPSAVITYVPCGHPGKVIRVRDTKQKITATLVSQDFMNLELKAEHTLPLPNNFETLREGLETLRDAYDGPKLAEDQPKEPPHPFVSTPDNGPCSSCGKLRSDRAHAYPEDKGNKLSEPFVDH